MNVSNLIGAIGVILLLVAFVLNTAKVLSARSKAYQGLNALGAAIAGVGALLVPFYPFVVLEGVWALVAIAALLRTVLTDKPNSEKPTSRL